MTTFGEQYIVLPNQKIITPTGMLVDVPPIRAQLLAATAATAAPTTTLPGEG